MGGKILVYLLFLLRTFGSSIDAKVYYKESNALQCNTRFVLKQQKFAAYMLIRCKTCPKILCAHSIDGENI